MKNEMIKTRTLPDGMRLIYMHKPGFRHTVFFAGFKAGGSNLFDSVDGKLIRHPTGCAHFLEHKMFTFNGQDVDGLMKDLHAEVNAYTTSEYTCYYFQTVRNWKEPLKLLLDFVLNLELSQASIDKEKGIILSEYGQFFSDPGNRLMHELFTSMYLNHPLNKDILGTREDISDMTLKQLESFYQLHYADGQMVLAGAGDADPDQVFDYAEKLLEKRKPSIEVKTECIFPDEPGRTAIEEKRIEMDVEIDMVGIAVKLKPVSDNEKAIQDDLMMNIWLLSQFGPLHPRFSEWLKEEKISSSVSTDCDISQTAAYIQIAVQSLHPREVAQEMHQILDEKQPVSQEVFEAIQTELLSSLIRARDSVAECAEELLRSALFNIDPDYQAELLRNMDAKMINEYVAAADLSNRSTVFIVPALNESETLMEEFETDTMVRHE